MKKNFFIAALLLVGSFAAHAQDNRARAQWADIGSEGYYYLTDELPLSSDVHFAAGTKFQYVSMVGGGFAPVYVLEVKPAKCENPAAEVEMTLMTPAGRDDSEAVGIAMGKNCALEFYIEQKDLVSPSFFTESTE